MNTISEICIPYVAIQSPIYNFVFAHLNGLSYKNLNKINKQLAYLPFLNCSSLAIFAKTSCL